MASDRASESNGSPDRVSEIADPLSFGLIRDPWGRLVLIDTEGRRHVGVEPMRGFPITDPERWISICDAEGRELVCVEALASLPAGVRQILEEELGQREFVPVVHRIVSVST